jgi:hypothetical protein
VPHFSRLFARSGLSRLRSISTLTRVSCSADTPVREQWVVALKLVAPHFALFEVWAPRNPTALLFRWDVILTARALYRGRKDIGLSGFMVSEAENSHGAQIAWRDERVALEQLSELS